VVGARRDRSNGDWWSGPMSAWETRQLLVGGSYRQSLTRGSTAGSCSRQGACTACCRVTALGSRPRPTIKQTGDNIAGVGRTGTARRRLLVVGSLRRRPPNATAVLREVRGLRAIRMPCRRRRGPARGGSRLSAQQRCLALANSRIAATNWCDMAIARCRLGDVSSGLRAVSIWASRGRPRPSDRVERSTRRNAVKQAESATRSVVTIEGNPRQPVPRS
jgi:hypothetical protein